MGRQANNYTSANGSSESQSYERPKRVLTLGNCDASTGGPRQTIKSIKSLNDYSAYRAGDQFYVVLPEAASGKVTRGAGGRACYTEMRVEQRGSDVVLIYRLKPGVKARAEQTFNRLDVVFEGPAEDATNAAVAATARQKQQARSTVKDSLTQPNVPASPPPVFADGNQPGIPSTEKQGLPASTTTQPEAMTNAPPRPTQDMTLPQPSSSPSPTTTGGNQPSGMRTRLLPASLLHGWWGRSFLVAASLLIVGIGLLVAARRRRSRMPPRTKIQAAGGRSAVHAAAVKPALTAGANTAQITEETSVAGESEASTLLSLTVESGADVVVEPPAHVMPADASHAIKKGDTRSETASETWIAGYLRHERAAAAGASSETLPSEITGVKVPPDEASSHTVEISGGKLLAAAHTSPGEYARSAEHFFAAGEPAAAGHSGAGIAAPPPPATDDQQKGAEFLDADSALSASTQERLNSREPAERAAAVAQLSGLGGGGGDEAFRLICAAFADEAEEVRSAAARALYDLRNDPAESFGRALREMGHELRPNLGAAINSSGLAGDAISQLTAESSEKSYEAFSILFLMAMAGEIQPLIQVVEAHPSTGIRLAVVKLLALSGQKAILPDFRRLKGSNSLPSVIHAAVADAIYQIGTRTERTPSG